MTAPPLSSAPAARRLLVRGVNWLGDAVMTTPALQRLREALPEAHITLLTHEKLADLWQHHPSLDAVLTFSSGREPVVGRRPFARRSIFKPRWSCPIRPARRWKSGWRESRSASAAPGAGETGS